MSVSATASASGCPLFCAVGQYGCSGSGCGDRGPVCANCSAGRSSRGGGCATDANNYTASSNPLVCAACPDGSSTNGRNGTVCTNCTAGTYANSSIIVMPACLKCARGFWCPEGSASATAVACPAGTYGAEEGLANATCSGKCSVGFYCPPGSTNATSVPCPAGRYGNTTGLTSGVCSGPCPVGYSCPLNSTNATATPCPPKTFSEGGAAVCSPCPESGGFACPGASDKIQCAAGSYAPRGSPLAECLLCDFGKWTDKPGQTLCENECPAGTYGFKRGAATADSCRDCAANTYSTSKGSSQCGKCDQGTGGPPGSRVYPCPSVCLPNEVVTTAPPPGDSSRYCKTCDVSKGLAPNAAQTACENGVVICPAGQMLSFLGRGCEPLVCPPPLARGDPLTSIVDGVPATIGAQCIGCPNGTVGMFGNATTLTANCTPCNASDFCVGPVSLRLADFSGVLALAAFRNGTVANGTAASFDVLAYSAALAAQTVAAAGIAAACPQLTGAAALPPPREQSTAPLGVPWLTNVLSVDSAILTFATLLAIFATLPFLARLERMQCLDVALRKFDLFPMTGFIPEEGSPVKRPTAVGGAFSCAGLFGLATAATVLALQRDASNVTIARSVDVLGAAELAAFIEQPFRRAAGPWGSGLQVRITASCEPRSLVLNAAPGLVAPPSYSAAGGWAAGTWAHAGNAAGAWLLDNATHVAGAPRSCGADATTAQLIFRCPECTLTPASTLSVALPFSCQSLLIEAAAIDASGVASVLSADRAKTRGSSAGKLLAAVTWTVLPLASIVNSSVSSQASARGYTLASAALKTEEPLLTLLNIVPQLGNATTLSPGAAAILITVEFPLDPFFVNVRLTERVPVLTLLTSIVGLSGIFAAFGILRNALYALSPEHRRGEEKRIAAQLASKDLAAKAARAADLAELREMIRAEIANERDALPAHGSWRRHSTDTGGRVWYLHETGAFSARLPRGAVIEDAAGAAGVGPLVPAAALGKAAAAAAAGAGGIAGGARAAGEGPSALDAPTDPAAPAPSAPLGRAALVAAQPLPWPAALDPGRAAPPADLPEEAEATARWRTRSASVDARMLLPEAVAPGDGARALGERLRSVLAVPAADFGALPAPPHSFATPPAPQRFGSRGAPAETAPFITINPMNAGGQHGGAGAQ